MKALSNYRVGIGSTLALITLLLFCNFPVVGQTASHPPISPCTGVTGSGTINYVAIWTLPCNLGNSAIYQTGGSVGIGTTTPSATLDVNGSINAAANYQIGGGRVLAIGDPNDGNVFLGEASGQNNINGQGQGNIFAGGAAGYSNTNGKGNTFMGNGSGYSNTVGSWNSFVGFGAGNSNTGDVGTFLGSYAGYSNTTGIYNTFTGGNAGYSNTTGNNNTFTGLDAGFYNSTGGANTFMGFYSGNENSTGSFNTFYGSWTGYHNSGSNNLFVGTNAGYNNTSGNNNIYIDNQGPMSGTENNTIRIGTQGSGQGQQTAAYVAGIYGVNNSGIPVFIDSNGQLGTSGSSLRFKDNVLDMGASSSKLFQLRPVTFFYKPQYDDGSHSLQYGLIAEEVAKVYPEMVAYDKDGQPYTVKYQLLAPMLLNELQKQHGIVTAQQKQIVDLQGRLAQLESIVASK